MWDDDVHDDDGHDHALAMAEQDARARERVMRKNAYAEAATKAREEARQEGFEHGVSEGISMAVELGRILGSTCSMLMYFTRPENADKVSKDAVAEMEALYQDVYLFDPLTVADELVLPGESDAQKSEEGDSATTTQAPEEPPQHGCSNCECGKTQADACCQQQPEEATTASSDQPRSAQKPDSPCPPSLMRAASKSRILCEFMSGVRERHQRLQAIIATAFHPITPTPTSRTEKRV
ncbi:hypothetical protein PTSG_01837 [Salpingoeca rosetta]|uniref:Essential protein Yae1 N-terminal domain-containing protein n=1 Tax=Salpingoeca rosetta (strain ATCC 50818 / BSB-021) TaxID=946362 RepID=F2TZ35_SALR5|nr:uncharacterized protein PTSG_01837 [Salpingoeca rosetta]EGD78859.1 hypothetical protein PTSG_01837 [Salpingoeca rosetta]|eukprot:XP_004997815.1 hypothetical protein PTSG_01837 [Salpingoeca rosetta]